MEFGFYRIDAGDDAGTGSGADQRRKNDLQRLVVLQHARANDVVAS